MGKERRRFERVRLSAAVFCRHDGAFDEPWQPVALLNFSAGGVSFTSDDLFTSGSSLQIKIQLPTEPAPLLLLGVLRRVESRGPHVVECGAEFVEMTPDQQLKLDEFVQFFRKRPS